MPDEWKFSLSWYKAQGCHFVEKVSGDRKLIPHMEVIPPNTYPKTGHGVARLGYVQNMVFLSVQPNTRKGLFLLRSISHLDSSCLPASSYIRNFDAWKFFLPTWQHRGIRSYAFDRKFLIVGCNHSTGTPYNPEAKMLIKKGPGQRLQIANIWNNL